MSTGSTARRSPPPQRWTERARGLAERAVARVLAEAAARSASLASQVAIVALTVVGVVLALVGSGVG